MRQVRKGEIYRHFKGQLYQIVTVAKHSETEEDYVVYQALYGDMAVWLRPYKMFVEEVDRNKYPEVVQKYRFELLSTLAVEETKDFESGYRKTDTRNVYNIQDTEDGHNLNNIQSAVDMKNVNGMHSVNNAQIVQTVKVGSVTQSGIDLKGYQGQTENIVKQKMQEQCIQNIEDENEVADKRLIEFLNADTYREKINCLRLMKSGITDKLIDDMAASLDLMINEGSIVERFDSLIGSLEIKSKYECSRLR